MLEHFAAALTRRVLDGTPPACVGLDPRLEALPASLVREAADHEDPREAAAAAITAFYEAALPVLAKHVPVVKPNIAFFERYGAPGVRAYEATCAMARTHGMLVIGDIKRGDIGSTAEAYADAGFAHADAVTLHPYLGLDSIAPFLKASEQHSERHLGVFVLVRTSNKSAADFQDLRDADGRTLSEAVADAVDAWGKSMGDANEYSPVGAVVGATWPEELATLRARMPRAWILIPGIGAQGGQLDDTRPAFDQRGLGGIVTQSRGIMQCFAPDATNWLSTLQARTGEFAQATTDLVKQVAQSR